MNRRTTAFVAALAAAVAIGLTAAQADATAPGKNGLIAFERYRFSDHPLWSEIWVIESDGTGERKVSQTPRGYLDRAPDWSPDGSHIAFLRCPPTDRPCEIWAVKPDGGGQKRLSPHCPPGGRLPQCVWDGAPSYSPDGKHIAFERDSGRFDFKRDRPYSAAIMVSDTSLGRVRRVAWFGAYRAGPAPSSPAWSPDGKQIAFAVGYPRAFAIYVVEADGTGLRRLTPWKLRAGAGPEGIDWSPDGTRILFRTRPLDESADLSDSGGNLYTIRPNGTGLRQLTHFDPIPRSPGDLRNGSFSPDGSSIVFATNRGAVEDPPNNGLPDLFVMSSDGTDIRPVTRSKEWDGDPDWGPG